MDLRIKGKVAVVTGASRGLGKAVAMALAREGVNLAICSRNKNQIIASSNSLKRLYGIKVLPLVCDVTKEPEVTAFRDQIIDEFKTCHILFTNADGPLKGNVNDFSSKDFQCAINLNLMSTINLVKAFLPSMVNQKWGRIIALASSNVRVLLNGNPLSNVSRLGVAAFIKSVAMEFAECNITANVVAPGDFMTNLTKKYLQKYAQDKVITYHKALEELRNSIPTKTIGDPSDFGAIAAFFASEYTAYLTGETILIDGGKYCGSI